MIYLNHGATFISDDLVTYQYWECIIPACNTWISIRPCYRPDVSLKTKQGTNKSSWRCVRQFYTTLIERHAIYCWRPQSSKIPFLAGLCSAAADTSFSSSFLSGPGVPGVRSMGPIVSHWLRDLFADLTDVTLADEDTKLTMPIGQSKAMWLNWWDNL